MEFFSKLITQRIISFLRKWRLVNLLLGAIDIFAITFAFQLAYYINYRFIDKVFINEKNFLILFLAVLPFWLIVLYFMNVTEIPRTKRYPVLFYEYLQSALAIGIMLLVIYFIFKMSWISRLFLIEFTLFGFIFLLLVRITEYKVFKRYRAQGYNFVNVVLIADDTSAQFIERLIENREWGFKIIAIFSTSQKLKEKYEKTIILLPENYITVLSDLMEKDIIDEVIYIKNKEIASEVRNIMRSCEELGVTFMLKLSDNKLNLTNAIRTNIENEKFLTFINVPSNIYALTIKKIMDINISLLLIIFLSPFLAAVSILIWVSSKGPVIYKQERVGLRGRMFNLYKFRTMVVNADDLKKDLVAANEADGPVFKLADDPRVTPIGGFLRRSGLDELPQLINVLKGEMSLIGPRPPLKEETLKYKRWHLRRLSVKPGMSCFWQIEPNRNKIKFEKWMEMDLAYIDNWSLRLDFIIFLKTIRTVFKRTGL